MSENLEFILSEKTFAKMLELKTEMGYEDKEWDIWLDFICNRQLKKTNQNEIEQIMEKANYDTWYDKWISNFALNLNSIWNESSARILSPKEAMLEKNNSVVVIGRGPSIKEQGHLELLAKSDYNGSIMCCDGALQNALRAGVTPDKFPKFYVATIDAGDNIKEFYDDKIVDKYGSKIKGIFATVSSPLVVERARGAGIKIHWLHALFDYHEGKKSFNQISALMVRSKNHINGLPGIQTGGNIGTSSWFIGWQILKCPTVALIGINHSWNENDSWETIISHGHGLSKVDIDKNSTAFKKLFPKIYNPEFNCYCILDPLFQYYSNALKEFISRSPSWVKTINATEGG